MRFIDLSNVNGTVDFKAAATVSDLGGVLLKATEGRTFQDARFKTWRKSAGEAGLRVGAYHFARPDRNDPVSEARSFATVVGKLGSHDLRPVLDFEHSSELTPTRAVEWARSFNREAKRLLGVWPVFYTYPAFLAGLSPHTVIGAGLWIADYGRNDGTEHAFRVPAPWRKAIAHQFTSRGTWPGVHSLVDVSSVPSITPWLAYPVRSRVRRALPYLGRH